MKLEAHSSRSVDVQFTWTEINRQVKSFQFENEPEVIHVIKTGFEDDYMVIKEYGLDLNSEIIGTGNKNKIEEKFNIKL